MVPIKRRPLTCVYTLENLESLNCGLNIQQGDCVLSAGCSGDQPFSFLEKASRVVAVDVSSAQISYIQRRVRALKQGDFDTFLEIPEQFQGPASESNLKPRNAYFTKPGRFDAIRQNLGKLEVLDPEDIFKVAKTTPGFNKMHFSNAMKCAGNDYLLTQEQAADLLEQVSGQLRIGGLILVSNHSTLFKSDELPERLKGKLQVDKELTTAARKLDDGWNYAVYRKV